MSIMLERDIFLKSVFICALETIFFINNQKDLDIVQILENIELSAFDFWRILNSYIKFDPLMPCGLKNHFREIEIKIVTEMAW